MIVAIFIITGFNGTSKIDGYGQALNSVIGPTFWDQNFLSLMRLENVGWIASRVPDLAINVCFMLFALSALAFNIVTRCVPNFIDFVPADLWLATSTCSKHVAHPGNPR